MYKNIIKCNIFNNIKNIYAQQYVYIIFLNTKILCRSWISSNKVSQLSQNRASYKRPFMNQRNYNE